MKPITIASFITVGLLIAGAIVFTKDGSTASNNRPVKEPDNSSVSNTPSSNVSVIDGKQIIEITARGGYEPRKSVAKAGVPTTLRLKTNGTFDCSSAVRLPSLDINKYLPQTGETDIDLGTPLAGTFQGLCGMGMYRFEINFKN